MMTPGKDSKLSGPQACPEEHYEQLVAMLNKWLLHDNGTSIEAQTPTAVTRDNLGNLRVIMDGSVVAAHVAMKYDTVMVGIEPFRVSKISAVCTRGEYRRRGLALRLLENCRNKMQSDNIDVSVLWTAMQGFYEQRGWQYAGCEVTHRLTRLAGSVAPSGPYVIGPTPQDMRVLHMLRIESPYARVRRTLDETKTLLEMEILSVITAYRENQPTGYIASRRSDSGTKVLESAGPPEALVILIHELFDRDSSTEITMHTAEADPRHALLMSSDTGWVCKTQKGSSGMWWVVPTGRLKPGEVDFDDFYVEHLDRV